MIIAIDMRLNKMILQGIFKIDILRLNEMTDKWYSILIDIMIYLYIWNFLLLLIDINKLNTISNNSRYFYYFELLLD